MKTVKLIKNYGSVFSGETAGYPDDEADAMIASGIAQPLALPPAEVPQSEESVVAAPPADHPLASRKRKR